jgi:hypothetical protein
MQSMDERERHELDRLRLHARPRPFLLVVIKRWIKSGMIGRMIIVSTSNYLICPDNTVALKDQLQLASRI